jgi:hypothetical protein
MEVTTTPELCPAARPIGKHASDRADQLPAQKYVPPNRRNQLFHRFHSALTLVDRQLDPCSRSLYQ